MNFEIAATQQNVSDTLAQLHMLLASKPDRFLSVPAQQRGVLLSELLENLCPSPRARRHCWRSIRKALYGSPEPANVTGWVQSQPIEQVLGLIARARCEAVDA